MTDLVHTPDGTGFILKDAIRRSENFDWKTHYQWLSKQSIKIRKLNERYPINLVYRVDDRAPILAGTLVVIDGYGETVIGVIPLGSTMVVKISPVYLNDVTRQVRRQEITEMDVMKSLASIATIPPPPQDS